MEKKPLRIALFTGLYAPFLTGVSVAVHQRVHWLLEQGHEVFLIHPQINKQYSQQVGNRPMVGLSELQNFSNFSSYAFPTQPLIFYKALPQPLNYRHWSDTKLLENFQPDIIVVEEAAQMRGLYSIFLQGYGRAVGVDYAKRTKTPIISVFHTDIVAYIKYYLGDILFRLMSPIIPLLVRQFSDQYTLNIFPSKEQLKKYQKLQCQRCEYVPYQGINCEKFHPRNICHDPIPNDKRPTILFVGRITAEKNVTQILEAYPLIAAKIPDVHLVIVGSGPLDQEIRHRAQKFADGVTIWGESHGTELLGWFARADVFINPSVTENFCTTNNEALASGTPVVAVMAPSTAEQVTIGYNGLLAQPNNPKDFADKIVAILQNPDLKNQLSSQARPSILQFDWSNCSQKFEDKLYELVNVTEMEFF
ncbi:glycosyltransferase family 4 protein [Cylindrospermopsis raciborskii]|uniref:Group 1 glycosyl transferase n=1 Tax=Cylindrospermopsis raciborskii CENA302 TaxID=1170768 RepID=A0A9Q5QVL5_9CYAN|nr:glycosyltransferase family 4 protein [Cylindrospermopsis raciborskii]MCZ2200814.1 glycosyltransferase family 4 protein [Cylindrospermopsis raciborskii PAMP2012]MCZ2204662.1 glycosyltransferase family 4 protein [Cylindrospermopsis raciborskii PAMP2011]NLQ03684.1 glycosyltransferase family 4 protein [Cylindrospermopsis raciborskii MVCC19]OHY31860.1 group 1 glycosyl transferase [Cylindrospermopsis raciborskii MVCC14]OPH09077.1 group 1 glycosyl transferase [Cylindrospermopsis raciborskii CENA30